MFPTYVVPNFSCTSILIDFLLITPVLPIDGDNSCGYNNTCKDRIGHGGQEMPPIFKTIVNVSVWILFIKGILLAFVTFYTFGSAYLSGEGTPIAGIASCAAGTFAFIMACIAVWIRRKLE